jgi:hypothetical protein
MADHTPGPWTIEESNVGYGPCYYIEGGDGSYVIHGEGTAWSESDKANARLIAAAPELLEALKVAADALGSEEGMAAAYRLAREAIAKAEGQRQGGSGNG